MRNMNTYLGFINMEKAYDSVSISSFFQILEASEINKTYTIDLEDAHKNSRSVERIGSHCLHHFNYEKI